MKKFSFSFLFLCGLMSVIFFACNNDDDDGVTPAPSISSINPTSGPVGTSVTITGTNFGESPTVNFGSAAATVGSASATSITTTVPTGLAAGEVDVTVTANGETSEAVTFEVTEEDDGDDEPTGGVATIADTLGTFDDLSSLAAAVEAAGLVETLQGDGPFTVFAPNNAAFEAVLAALELDDLPALVEALGEDGVASLLLAHVVADSLPAADLMEQAYLTANEEDSITITMDGDAVLVNGAAVVQADIAASNGIVHVIDSVINLPEGESVGDGTQNEGHPYADLVVPNGKILFGPISGDRTLDADTVYYLDGYVFVESGTLTIEPGTVIMGFADPSEVSEGNETSLIITREAMIDAEGTAEEPIIFTSELDEEALGGEPNLGPFDSKLWAGLIVLGKAPTFSEGATEVQIEGIPDGEARALYGGTEEAHSSGTLKYVSIRFTGAEIGPGDEIQGLTLGGVGSETVIEDIDIFVSADDGIEIFGGTVNLKRISVAFAEDDSFDFDLGWSGYGQYLFAIQGGNEADHGGEWDGAKPDNAALYTNARIYNATFIGLGLDADNIARDVAKPAIIQRDGAALSIYNSIITDFNGKGIEIEDRGEGEDSFDKLINQDINTIAGNIWYVGNANSLEEIVAPTAPGTGEDMYTPREEDAASLSTYLSDNNNTFVDPELGGISREADGGLNPVPAATAVTENVVADLPDADADATSFKGAFDPAGEVWISGWTTLARFGFLQ